MQSEIAVIPAGSKRQAMDWSLVLLSQGIEATIQGANEEHGWQLIVAPLEYEHALRSIRQYRAENRADLWRRYLPLSGLIFDWRSIIWFSLLSIVFALGEMGWGYLAVAGRMHNQAVWAGQWWRLFTATMLHADVVHLVANVTTGVLLLGLAMGSFGPGFALFAAYLAGAAGNLAGLLLYPESHQGLGASGMVMGALGLLTAQSLMLLRARGATRPLIMRAFMGGTLLLVLWGVNPASDVVAHVAGFLAGIVLGALLAIVPMKVLQNKWANRVGTSLCAGLMVWTWWLAIS